ncbi:MAG: flagellar basal body-associated FliL family protein, partial [Pseudomonadota bacterium]
MADKDEDGKAEAQEIDLAAEVALKKKKKKKKIIILIVLLVLVGGGARAYFGGFLTSQAKVEATTKKGKKKKNGEEEPGHGTTGSSVKAVKQNLNEWTPGIVPGHENDDLTYYNLPEYLVNLNTGGKQTSFIKMKITLEIPEGSDIESIESRMPRINDSFNTYLRELRAGDIAGSAGLY